MQKGVIYARYSSHAQRDVSIDQQELACRQYAQRQEIEILDVYADRAISGTTDSRPAFQRMIQDAAAGVWDYVIVYTMDRFARDRYDSAVYKRQLRQAGVRVLSAMEQIGDDPTGVLMEGMLESLAEYYSAELARKVARGLDDNASRCLVNGYCPLGYRRGSDGRYEIQESEAAIVREIFQRVADGEQLIGICRDLNARGLRTRKGSLFNRSSFNSMLRNERYRGVYLYKDKRIEGGIPAIISPELWAAVQQQMGTRANPRQSFAPQRRRRERGTYLLTGRLYCGECGEPMVGVSGTGRSGSLIGYYKCRGRHNGSGCHKANHRQDFLEDLIARELKRIIFRPRTMATLADAAIAYQDTLPHAHDAQLLQSQLDDVRRSLSNLVRAIEMGIFSATTQQRLSELEREQSRLSAALELAKAQAAQQLTREEILATLELFAAGDLGDPAYQAALLDAFLVRADVYDDHLRILFSLGDQQRQTVTLPTSPAGDPVRISDDMVDHIVLYESPPIYMICGAFAFSAALPPR